MAISSPFDVNTDAGNDSHVVYLTDTYSVVIYNDTAGGGGPVCEARVITTTADPPTVGSAVSVYSAFNTAIDGIRGAKLTDTTFIVQFRVSGASLVCSVGSLSGSTLSFPAGPTTVDGANVFGSGDICALTSTLCFSAWTDTGTDQEIVGCPIPISGTTATPGTIAVIDTATSSPFGAKVARLNTDRCVVTYRDGSSNFLAAAVTSITTTFTPGSPITLGTQAQGSISDIDDVTDDKAILLFNIEDNPPQSAGYKFAACILSYSGGLSKGTTLYIDSGDYPSYNIGISAYLTTKAIITYRLNGDSTISYGTLTISGTTITDDGSHTSVGSTATTSAIDKVGGYGVLSYAESTIKAIGFINEGGGGGSTTQAKFYFGQGPGAGVLAEKFTLPFGSVAPQALTASGSLGTVVIGSKVGAGSATGSAVIYSNYPYSSWTDTDTGFPTGTAISAVKWV